MPETTPRRFPAAFRVLLVLIVTFDLAFVGQKLAGAYDSEFGAHPDEAAHCVTGLFVRDALAEGARYAASGFKGSPVQAGRDFANNFYAHYPKVALGVWPPAFHTVQAVWTLPFGASRFSLLLLMALLAAAVATLVFEVAFRSWGWWPACVATVMWLGAPLPREHTSLLMAEMLSALAMLGATLAWGRFLDQQRRRDVIYFALLASAAIMTKGTGLALMLMCALSLVLTRRWRSLRAPSFWVAVLIVAVLAGIWTWIFRNEGTRVGGWEGGERVSWEFTRTAAPYYARALAQSVALAVLGFAVIGAFSLRRSNPIWVSLATLVVAVFVFQSVVPVGHEARHILSATPALVLLSIAGAFALARQSALASATPAVQRKRERLWVLLVALLALPQAILAWEPKGYAGFKALALETLELASPGARVLIVSDASGEGMFISEIALHDQRPNLVIARGSKVLVDPEGRTWAGKNLHMRFDDAELLDDLLRSEIQFVALDAAIPEEKRASYHDQIRRVILENTGTFWPVAESPVRRENEYLFPPLRLYRIVRDRQAPDRERVPRVDR